jgi:outer membrane protein assembly factor BamA
MIPHWRTGPFRRSRAGVRRLLPLMAACGVILGGSAIAHGQEPGRASPLDGLPIASIAVEGLVHLDENVVLRRLDLRVGAPYRSEVARRDERAVSALSIFWLVRITPLPLPDETTPTSVAVVVEARERFAWFLVPQLRWTPEEKWSYGLAGGHLSVGGHGHRLYITALTGGARYLSASLSNPWNGPNHQSFAVGGAVVRISNQLYDFHETGERLTGELGRWFGARGRGRIGFRYQRISADRAGVTLSSPAEDRLHSVWGSLGWDSTDPWAHPRLGHIATLRVERSGGFLGGDLRGGTLTAGFTTHETLGGDWVVALLGLAEARYGDVPFWRLLSVGGPNSVRGYPLGRYLVRRRWEAAAEVQWYAVPMRSHDLGALGAQILGISLSVFADLGAGLAVARGPGTGPWGADTPVLRTLGLGATLHNASFGNLRLEVAWPDDGSRRIIFRLGNKL